MNCKTAVLCAGMTLFLSAAELPAPRPIPQAKVNIDPNGPPLPATPPIESPHPAAIPLWPNGAPGSEARKDEPENISWRQEPGLLFPVISNIHNPSITPFLPAPEKATGCAVIIAPGGGGMQLTIDREGYDLARWFADRGIAAFVLKYRLSRDISNPPGTPQPYQDVFRSAADCNRAVRYIRGHAAELHVQPDRIGFMGFSAGAEIIATTHDAGSADSADPLQRLSSRPDFFALIYPGGLNRPDMNVTKETVPPTFLVCSYDDRMPEQMANFFIKLRQAGVNAELHIYSSGGHGFGVRTDRPELPVSTWHVRFTEWLGDRGFLKR